MLLNTSCTFILHDVLSPLGSTHRNLFAFLQHDFDPASTVEFILHRLPRPNNYETYLYACSGNMVHDALVALLKSIKRLSEEMRRNPPVELLVGVIRRIYDSSVDLADVLYRDFDYISSTIPLSRVTKRTDIHIIDLVLIDPSPDELLKLDKLFSVFNGKNVDERIDAVYRYLAEMYAEHDEVPEIPSLASYLRYLATRLDLVKVNAERHTIAVAGVELVPPSEHDFEKVVEVLGLQMQYYGAAPASKIAYKEAVFKKVQIKANVIRAGDGVRLLVHPESFTHMLHEGEPCPSLYMLVKTVKREQSMEADAYLVYVHGDGYSDATKVLTVDVTACNGNVSCIAEVVGKAARKQTWLITVFRLIRELRRRGYNIRLIHTKHQSWGSHDYVDLFEVRATKVSGNAMHLISCVSWFGAAELILRVAINDPRYAAIHYYYRDICRLADELADKAMVMLRPNVYTVLHGVRLEMVLKKPEQVVPVLEYVEEFYRGYVKLLMDGRVHANLSDGREAVVVYLAVSSAARYDPNRSFHDVYSASVGLGKTPPKVLITLCNDYLMNLGIAVTNVYNDFDVVLARLLDAGLVELDDDGFFRVLGFRTDHVIEKYAIPVKHELFDMAILESLLKHAGELRKITGGKASVRVVKLLLELAEKDADEGAVHKGLLGVVADAELWHKLPEDYRVKILRIGGRDLAIRAAVEGYYWALSGYLDVVLPMLETPSEKTLVVATTLKPNDGYSVYEHGGQYYIRYGNVVLQVCDKTPTGITFRGSVIGYQLGIVFTATSVSEAVEKVAGDILDAYFEFKELLNELPEAKQTSMRVEYEDAGLFKVPVIVVDATGSAVRLYLDKGIKSRLRELSTHNST